MDSEGVLKRWTDFCKGLFNYEFRPDTSTLQESQSSQRLPLARRKLAWFGHVRREACHRLQNHHARHRPGRTQTRETTKEPVRQGQGLDGDDLPTPPVDGRQQNNLQEDGCFFCPQVPATTAKVEGVSERVIQKPVK